jgi:hypothetical protein
MDWDPHFVDRSPMLSPLAAVAAPLRACADWPARPALQQILTARGVTNAGGAALRLVAPDPAETSYEARIRAQAEMPVREREWHDLFNVLTWAAYPRTKRALNEAHCRAPAQAVKKGARPRFRDALTLFDESGAIVVSSDADLLSDLRAFRWKRLFVERRDAVRASMRFYVFGHALFEKALAPYIGMTAHAVLVEATPAHALDSIDRLAAEAVGRLESPRALSPLPVLGVPGWWAQNEDARFYDDETYFRRGRRPRQPAADM